MTRIGYIGLGAMGSAMVSRLCAAGQAVTVFDLDPTAVATAVALGATAAGSAAEVAKAADIISICVPAAAHVEAVLSGPGGIHAGARAGQIVLIHSTVGPDTMLSARATAAAWGVGVHDVCVAGGTGAARTGELVILGGGLAEMPADARALLDVYGSKVIDGGPVGSGAALKLAFNVMTYAQFSAAATAFEIVHAAGGETSSLVNAWRHVGQLGSLTETFLPMLSMPPEHIRGAFRDAMLTNLAIADKDLDLAGATLGADSSKHPVLAAMRALMPEIYGVAASTSLPPQEFNNG